VNVAGNVSHRYFWSAFRSGIPPHQMLNSKGMKGKKVLNELYGYIACPVLLNTLVPAARD